MVWTHGTTGIAKSCAPSEAAKVRFKQIAGLQQMVDRGWTVIAPDYAGLGSRGPHPFLVADLTARTVADAARATAERPGNGQRWAVWGIGQGGHAALATAERARALAAALDLVGAAAAAPPMDLAANFGAKGKAVTKGVLTAFAAASWSKVYDAPLATLGGQRTQQLIQRMGTLCALGQGLKLTTILGAFSLGQRLKSVDLPGTQPWGRLLRRNSIDPRASAAVPLLITQGTKDDVVAPAVTRDFVRDACRAGARLRWIESPGGDHAGQAGRTADQTIAWLADHFAGRPAPSDCGRL